MGGLTPGREGHGGIFGLSRIYVGEHWASDVLGGWLSGGALVPVAALALRSWRLVGTDGHEAAGPAGTRNAP